MPGTEQHYHHFLYIQSFEDIEVMSLQPPLWSGPLHYHNHQLIREGLYKSYQSSNLFSEGLVASYSNKSISISRNVHGKKHCNQSPQLSRGLE